MLKMIIADDENLVREGLTTLLDWHRYDIDIIGYAKNGAEALSLCEDLNPDLLLTDIRMPQISGLEVIKRLQQRHLKTRYIVMSGYNEFSLAQEAIELKVENYILKPIKQVEVEKVIQKVVSSILEDREKATRQSMIRQQLEDNKDAIYNHLLMGILFNHFQDSETITQKLKYLNIPFDIEGDFTACKLVIDELPANNTINSEENNQLILISIGNVLKNIIDADKSFEFLTLSDMSFVIIASACRRTQVREICDTIQASILNYLNIPVSIGIGMEVHSITELSQSYKSSVEALDYRFYTGNASIIDILDVVPKNVMAVTVSDYHNLEKKMITAIKTGNTAEAIDLLNKIFDNVITETRNAEQTRALLLEMIIMVSRSLYDINEDIDQILSHNETILNTVAKMTTLSQIKRHIYDNIKSLALYFQEKLSNKHSYTIHRLLSLINDQYAKDISVQSLALQVDLTPNYISQIFKREMGQTITKYITQTRIEAAKTLLSDSDFKVYEVAEMVGFDNPYYFSTVFKKLTGIHPSKYN